MFADFAPSTDFSTKSATIVVKDRHLLPVQGKTRPTPESDQCRLALSQEERQLFDYR
jgi:hypothetical protein